VSPKILGSLIALAISLIGGSQLLSSTQPNAEYSVAYNNLHGVLESSYSFYLLNNNDLVSAYQNGCKESSACGSIDSGSYVSFDSTSNNLLSCAGTTCLRGEIQHGQLVIYPA